LDRYGYSAESGDTLRESATGTLTFADGHTAEATGKGTLADLLRQYPLPDGPRRCAYWPVGSSEASVPFLLARTEATAATAKFISPGECHKDLVLTASTSQDTF